MLGELVPVDLLFSTGLSDQPFGQCGRFPVSDHPADHIPAEDVDNDIELKIGPFGGPFSLVISQDQTSSGLVASNSGF